MYTFNTPQPIALANAIKVNSLAEDPSTGNVAVGFQFLDASGNELAQRAFTIPSTDVPALAAAGLEPIPAALYSYLAEKLNLAAGTAAAD